MKYRTIVADPPWPMVWRGGAKRFGSGNWGLTGIGYETMTVAEISALPVAAIADRDAALFLWVTARLNREGVGVSVARAWGFEPTAEFVWAKRMRPAGGFPRTSHEIVLVCRRGGHRFGRSPWVSSVQQWTKIGQDQRHSAKPEGFLDLVEQYSPGPYVELFSRRHRLGWDVWGNESANTAQLGEPA